VENRRIHTSTRTNIKKQMKRNITTILATALAISSVSLLVGCGSGIEDDPDAAAHKAQEAEEEKLTPEEKEKFDAEIAVPEPEEEK
jgi:hypothetical protein